MLTMCWTLIALPLLIAARIQVTMRHLRWRAKIEPAVDRHDRRTSSGTLSVVR